MKNKIHDPEVVLADALFDGMTILSGGFDPQMLLESRRIAAGVEAAA